MTDHLPEQDQVPAFLSLLLSNHVALLTNPVGILDAPFLFPIPHSLALTENVIGLTFFFSPFYLLTDSPVLAFNLMVFICFVLSATCFFLLAHHYLANRYAAFIGGLIYGFASYRFANIDDVHMANLALVPLTILLLQRAIETKRVVYFALFSAAFTFQVYSGLYMAFFLSLCLVIFCAFHAKEFLNTTFLRRFLASAAMSTVMVLPLVYAYVVMRIDYPIEQWKETLNWLGLDPVDHLRVLENNVVYGGILQTPKTDAMRRWAVFPGFSVFLLTLLGIFSSRGPSRVRTYFVTLVIVSFVFSLGTSLKFNNAPTDIPLPYLLVTSVTSSIRCSWRYVFPLMLGVSFLSALGVAHLLRRRDRRAALLLTVGAGVIILLENLNVPMKLWKVEEPDRHIFSGIEAPVVHYPSDLTEDPSHPLFWELWRREFKYMFYQPYYGQPTVNGNLSYHPEARFETNERIKGVPTGESLRFFAALGVRYLSVHKDLFFQGEQPYRPEDFALAGLTRIRESERVDLFRIDEHVNTSPEIQLGWTLANDTSSGSVLTLTFTPPADTIWVNPHIGKLRTGALTVIDRATGRRRTRSFSFALPLVLMERKELHIPILGIHAEAGWDAALELPGTHFRYPARRTLGQARRL
jgi:hypothetical protein